MKDELQIAYAVRKALNHGLDDIDPKVASRLFEARQAALGCNRARVGGLRLAGFEGFLTDTLFSKGRILLAGLALVTGVFAANYWNEFQKAGELEEIDSALLADELPPAAFLDNGFQAWLDHSSRDSE